MLEITEVFDKTQKTAIINECDSAFTISVIGRPNYNELVDKIHKKAVFLKAVTEEGTLAGYAAFYANDKETGVSFMTLFCIKREIQRHHYGSVLMSESIAYARKLGMLVMKLEVLESDIGAISFYQKCGFVFTGKRNANFIEMSRELR